MSLDEIQKNNLAESESKVKNDKPDYTKSIPKSKNSSDKTVYAAKKSDTLKSESACDSSSKQKKYFCNYMEFTT
jgi:hypothetical protein